MLTFPSVTKLHRAPLITQPFAKCFPIVHNGSSHHLFPSLNILQPCNNKHGHYLGHCILLNSRRRHANQIFKSISVARALHTARGNISYEAIGHAIYFPCGSQRKRSHGIPLGVRALQEEKVIQQHHQLLN